MRRYVLATFLLTLSGTLVAQQRGFSNDVNFYTSTPGLRARIAKFTAEPATSKAGQPVQLEWLVENPMGVEIAPGIGAVLARGGRQVNPQQTTTYVMTEIGRAHV